MPNHETIQPVPDLLGFALKEARKSQHRTLRSVAAEAGISLAYLVALEQGKNPKTGKPSVPSQEIAVRLEKTLGIVLPTVSRSPERTPPPTEPPLAFVQRAVVVLETGSHWEKEKAAKMVLQEKFEPTSLPREFGYQLELAKTYTSAAVALKIFVDNLDQQIQELKTKYGIQESNKPPTLT